MPKRSSMESDGKVLSSAILLVKNLTEKVDSQIGKQIEDLASAKDSIITGADANSGNEVVDALEGFIPDFQPIGLQCAELKSALAQLDGLAYEANELPSVKKIREILSNFIVCGDSDYLEGYVSALEADCGSVVNDFLQGDILQVFCDVAAACVDFRILSGHIAETLLVIGEYVNDKGTN